MTQPLRLHPRAPLHCPSIVPAAEGPPGITKDHEVPPSLSCTHFWSSPSIFCSLGESMMETNRPAQLRFLSGALGEPLCREHTGSLRTRLRPTAARASRQAADVLTSCRGPCTRPRRTLHSVCPTGGGDWERHLRRPWSSQIPVLAPLKYSHKCDVAWGQLRG